MPYNTLREGKIHIFGLNWQEEQYLEQYLTSIKAEYAKLGSDFFIREKHLKNAKEYLKWLKE